MRKVENLNDYPCLVKISKPKTLQNTLKIIVVLLEKKELLNPVIMIFRVNEDSIPRIEKLIIHKLSLPSWNLYQAMELDAFHVIYTVNHVTKYPCRLWEAHNWHPCSLNVGTRKKNWMASLTLLLMWLNII